MGTLRAIAHAAFALLLALSVAIWSVAPVASHAPVVFETIHDHFEMIETHGHAHGSLAEDVYWAMHGHSHDTADHDHSPAVLTLAMRETAFAPPRDLWRPRVASTGPTRVFRIERPPRA